MNFLCSTGKGTTNDGNTARKFFRDAKTSSRITGINLELIERFSTLLGAINCGEPIDVDRFEKYAHETITLYMKLYSWYYLPAHTHKLLFHGATVIKHMLLPIGKIHAHYACEVCNHYFILGILILQVNYQRRLQRLPIKSFEIFVADLQEKIAASITYKIYSID